jgi:imidazolonepropionase
MVEAGVIFTLLPGSIFFLGHRQYPPAREIIQKGGTIALASDFNPGSSMTRSLPLMMTLACIYMGLSWEEALTAVTLNAAKALNRHNRLGSLEAGKQADIILWDAPSAHYLPYHFGENLVCAVFKRGNLVFKKSECSSENDHD